MKCPNCGQEFEGVRCPNCGRPAVSSGTRILAVLIVVLLALPAGLFGACSAVFAATSLSGSFDPTSLLVGVVLMAVGFGVAYAVLRLAKGLWEGK